jgi:hypothetical protein
VTAWGIAVPSLVFVFTRSLHANPMDARHHLRANLSLENASGPSTKIAVNVRGRNEAGSFLFRHGMIAE